MFKHILVPTDGSPLATTALDHALALAAGSGAKVTVLTVVEPFHTFSLRADQLEETRRTYEAHSLELADNILGDAAARARALGIEAETVRVVEDEPYRAIIETALERSADLVAMASHGRRGLEAVLLGSQTMKVLTHSGVPVLVYR